MVETPALISRPPVHSGIATAARVRGIGGIFMPLVGALLGVLAIVFGIIALMKKTSRHGAAIAGIIAGSFAILVTVFLIVLVQLIPWGSFSLFPSSGRDALVAAQTNEKKDFKIGETAKIGPMDVKITKVSRGYSPTAADLEVMKLMKAPYEVAMSGNRSDPGVPLAEEETEYVFVEGTARLNGSPALGDDDTNVSKFKLNNVGMYIYNGNTKGSSRRVSVQSETAYPVTFMFRIRKDNPTLTLTYVDTIWKSISPIVGTEGAPRAALKYTIDLN